ncbi:MAG: sporulation integral membrane protein YtvI [Clostridiales bacterium]|jgi:sporulation integral membrane protein YtvI|nr:sporulation integral membrane protein YtvI [Clostridiales bacterium]
MTNFYARHKSALDKLIFAAALVIFVYIFISYCFSLFAPFIAGFIFSIILEPLLRMLTKRFKMGRTAASVVCLVILMLSMGVLSATIVSKIFTEAKSFLYSVPSLMEDMQDVIEESKKNLSNILTLIPESMRDALSNPSLSLVPLVTSTLGAGVKSGSWNVVSNIPGIVVGFVLSIVSAFFFMKDRKQIFAFASEKSPKWLSERLALVRKGMAYALYGYFKAELIMMSITACIVIIGLLIIKYPYALFVGLLISVIDALPIFGSGMILWPWAIINFINGNYSTGIGLLLIYGVVLITRQTLEPRILGSQIGIHPLLTLMSMYIGLKLFGVLGIIIGPAIVITIKAIYESQAKVRQEVGIPAENA